MGEDLTERAKSMDMRDWLGEMASALQGQTRLGRRPVGDVGEIAREGAAESAPSPIPTVAGPLVGYRLWRWDATGCLWSLYKETRWPAWAPLVAGESVMKPTHIPYYLDGSRRTATAAEHGIYAMKGWADLDYGGMERFVLGGRVAVWGLVAEHERGYRAQYAYPIELWRVKIPGRMPGFPIPPLWERDTRLIEARYGVPVLDGPGGARCLSGR